MSKNVLFVKNIMAPYRIFLFNKLQELSNNSDFNFDVFVMRKIKKGRYWKLDETELKFNFVVDKNGYYAFLLNRYHFHFNPKLIKMAISGNYTSIVLGSSWNCFNIILLVLLKKMGIIKSKLSIWSEANYLTEGARNDNMFKYYFRKLVLNSCDSSFLVPGKMAEITLFEKWGVDLKSLIYFPNIVNNSVFKLPAENIEKRRHGDKIVFLIVARLLESKKGILNFMQNISKEGKYQIRIAGEGLDRILYEDYIEKNMLQDKIKLLGNLTEEQLRAEYIYSSVFVLPSYSDPSPLSIVEASYMKLPLFISNRCGNHYEILSDKINGYIFNPNNGDEIKNIFNIFLNMPFDKMKEMGDNSYNIIQTKYNAETVLTNFINKI